MTEVKIFVSILSCIEKSVRKRIHKTSLLENFLHLLIISGCLYFDLLQSILMLLF